ncbi:glycosyltransferase family 4 protein [Thiosocius teredinicola]|uniref:glycosyltransferase family 4 protein n=1 Tax=Thiosocius teredinicola TaxID=1973002 RepID=UPI000990EDBA
MNLVLVISSLQAGGAERVMTEMANYWAVEGHRIRLITFAPSASDDFYPLDPRVERISLDYRRDTNGISEKLVFNWTRLLALRRQLTRLRPAAVISFMDSTNVLSILASAGLGAKTLISIRNNPKSRSLPYFWSLGRRLTYRFATAVVAQTEGAADWLRQSLGVSAVVIPNPLPSFAPIAIDKEPLVLCVGRLIYEKAHDTLISAFSRIAHEHPSWRLVILGDGPLREKLNAQISELELTNRVVLVGAVKDVATWYAKASVYVHSSRSEGFPNALLEAMAMSLPVVSTKCEFGPTDIIEHGENGLLVESDDIEGLASAIVSLISSPRLRNDLGRTASLVKEKYDQRRIMGRWEELVVQ